MAEKFTLLAIDDDKFCHKLVNRALADIFNVESALNGLEGLEKVNALKPHIILLDVEMPGINGFEVCDKIKQDPALKDIPVVFLSGRSSQREMIQGYEMGGSDYLVKPFKKEVLVAKLKILIEYREAQRQLQQRAHEAQKTAFTAMSGSSELGLVMKFVEKSYDIHSHDELANHLLNLFDTLGLKTVSLFATRRGPKWYTKNNVISPLEKDIVNLLKNDQRFHHFGCRTQINFSHLSILVKNMPIDDMDRYGRLKDLMAPIASSVDSKIQNLNTEDAFLVQNQEISVAFNNVQKTIESLTQFLQNNQSEGNRIIKQMFEELNHHIPHMGLEDDQEEYILDCIDHAITRAFNIMNASKDIENAFKMVLRKMAHMSKLRDELFKQHQERDQSDNEQRRTEESQSIELF